jgi:5-methylcytosine-specific restriction endonuclease McrA
MIRSDAGYAAQHVFERDAGICKLCGIDTVKRLQDARLEIVKAKQDCIPHDQYLAIFAAWKAAGWPDTTSRRWFDVDHILSVVDGGGECGLDNLQTLCCPCHKRKTAELAARRKRERQEAKKKDKP